MSLNESLADKASADMNIESGIDKGLKNGHTEVIDWDGDDDPMNPINWPKRERWTHVIIVAVLGLIPNMATTMIAPGVGGVVKAFDIQSVTITTLAVTIYLIGLALGPMLFSSLSEAYGRLPVYHCANILFVAFMIGCATSQTITQYMVLRVLSGFPGGLPLALGGGTVADVTAPGERALATMLFSLGPLLGPILGPVIGGWIAAGAGWRWTFGVLAIFGGSAEVASLLFLRETSPKKILERKTAMLSASTDKIEVKANVPHKTPSPQQVFIQALCRPAKFLIFSPVVLALSLNTALVFGVMYLLFTTYDDVFVGQYGFSVGESGLAYLGMGVALPLGIVVFSTLSPRVQAARMKHDGAQQPRPEYRLLFMIYLSPFVALGLFIYGWTAEYKVHWFVPILGTFFIGFGAYFVLVPTQLYLIELFGSKGAASALSAMNFLRLMGGTFLPLAGPKLYRALGYGWGSSLLGFIALAFVFAPVVFYKYGPRLRAMGKMEI